REEVVRAMLGTVDRTQVAAMLDALAAGDGARLLQVVAALADFSPDWSGVLDALAEALHRIQVQQLVPGALVPGDGIDAVAFAPRLRPEVVQLWYQMALGGRRDLHLAPSPRAGFEMTVLRMLAFRPAGSVPAVPEGAGPEAGAGASSASGSAPVASAAAMAAPVRRANATPADPSLGAYAAANPVTAAPEPLRVREPRSEPAASPSPAPAAVRRDDDLPPWMEETAAAQARDDAADALSAPVRQAPPSPFRADGIAIAPPPPTVERSAASTRALENAGQWLDLVAASGLSGPSREL